MLWLTSLPVSALYALFGCIGLALLLLSLAACSESVTQRLVRLLDSLYRLRYGKPGRQIYQNRRQRRSHTKKG